MDPGMASGRCIKRKRIERGSFNSIDIARYFVRIASETGTLKDPHVLNAAVCYFYRVVISGYSHFSKVWTADASTDLGISTSISPMLRAMQIATLSLAVDVCGDFEAAYARSAVAWSHFLCCEMLGKPGGSNAYGFEDINNSCRQLMKLKILLAETLHWDLKDRSVAGTFACWIAKMTGAPCSRCQYIAQHQESFMQFCESILHVCAFVLLPLGHSVRLVAAVVMAVCHGSFTDTSDAVRRNIATPQRVASHRIKRYFLAAASGGSDHLNCLVKSHSVTQTEIETSLSLLTSPPILKALVAHTEIFTGLYSKRTTVLEDIEEEFESSRASHSSPPGEDENTY